MIVLGISGLYHDSAATIVVDGDIIAAAQEERFTRIKHDIRFPVNAIKYCIKEAGVSSSDIDIVVFYDNPLLTLDRYLKNILAAGDTSSHIIEDGFHSMFTDKLWVHNAIRGALGNDFLGKCFVCEHHMSHAASAFYPSPFDEAVIVTLDGVGEWETMTVGFGSGKDISIYKTIHYPHSIGLLYSAFTYFCGFKVNSGDYKFMGLAPYGEPIYEQIIRDNIIDIKDDGSFRLNLKYFDYQYGKSMTNEKFECLFGGKRRTPESKITKREMDIAASAQKVVEDVIFKIIRNAKKAYGKGCDNLVLAGGVALNCVANGKVKKKGIFKNIWIQPAAGDAGGSLGSALYATYQKGNVKRIVMKEDSQKGSLLGPRFSTDEIIEYLDQNGYPYKESSYDTIFDIIAEELDKGKVIGLFQGRMEFGPRALGARSIIADPRDEKMQVKLNLKIKNRESFRPFAPSVLLEHVSEYFEFVGESPYMLLVANVNEEKCFSITLQEELLAADYNMLDIVKKRRSDIPAVTHVDYSARVQTVTKERNGYYYDVLNAFYKRTGCPVLINTSFNVRGEPIVCTPEDAYKCFMRTEMDMLVLENLILCKEKQPEFTEKYDWHNLYELD